MAKTKTINIKVELLDYDILLEIAETWAFINNYRYDSKACLIADYILRQEKTSHIEEPYFEEK